MKKLPKRRESPIERQIKRLRTRVAFLERALKRAKQVPRSLSTLARKRDESEHEARRKAHAEFFKQREIERYLNNPEWLRIAIESENEMNEFLKARGLEPDPSSIPEDVRRVMKKSQRK